MNDEDEVSGTAVVFGETYVDERQVPPPHLF